MEKSRAWKSEEMKRESAKRGREQGIYIVCGCEGHEPSDSLAERILSSY